MKKSKSIFAIATIFTTSIIIFSVYSCGNPDTKSAGDTPTTKIEESKTPKEEASKTEKGIGEIMHVELTNPLNEDMVSRGKGIYEMKCSACHKLTGDKIVGPGWSGVTSRRTPEWIMNMITNTDVMLDKDPQAQKLLETCMVRMPNQGLSMGDCRDILEFMRKNDAKK